MIRDTKENFIPAPYTVICHALMTKENDNHHDNVGKYNTHRIGAYHSIADAKRAIKDDLAATQDTMGGLLAGVSSKGRSYEIFYAEWDKIL